MESEGSQPQTAVKYAKHIGMKFKYSSAIRLILIELAGFIEYDKNPCPSFKDLAEITGYSKATILKSIETLVADGVIVRQNNAGMSVRGGTTNHYTLVGFAHNVPAPERVPDTSPIYPHGEYVYLLRTETGHFKIGCTTDPARRMQTFVTTLPVNVEYVCLIRCENRLDTERKLHIHFASKRRQGEWFDLTPDDVEYIKSLAVQS